jgi:hypothetical protein
MTNKTLAILSFISLSNFVAAQTNNCDCEPNRQRVQKISESVVCNLPKTNVNAYIQGFPVQQKIFVKKDSILTGFKMNLSDTSYKILGFKIFYEFPYDPFGSEVIMEDKVTPDNLKFLPHIKGYGEGYFEINCVLIEKDGKKYNANGFFMMLEDK